MAHNINPNQNYRRLSNGHIFTGKQILELLKLASPAVQALILLDIVPTDSPAPNPNDRYGVRGQS